MLVSSARYPLSLNTRCSVVLPLVLLAGLAQAGGAAPPPAPGDRPAAAATFSLAEAVSAMSTSVQSRQAQLALQIAQLQLQTAQAATGFTVGVTSSLNAESGSSIAANTALSSTVGVSLSLPVLPWSGANLAVLSASRSADAASFTYAQASLTLLAATEQAYGRAVTAGLDLNIAQQQLTLAQRQSIQAQAFYADNNAALPAVQGAQAEVQNAQTVLLKSQAEYESARRALGILIGRDVGGAALNPDLSASVTALATLPTQTLALTAARHFSPVLLAAQTAVAAAQSTLDSARRSRDLPATSLSASYGSGSGAGRTGLSAGLNVNSGLASIAYSQPLSSGVSTAATGTATSPAASIALGLSASFNILDPAADGTLKVAALQLQQAQAALTLQRQSVDQSLLDAYSAARIAGQAIAARQSSVQSFTTALDTTRSRLAAGLTTETEVLNAQIALAQAERDLNTAQLSALVTAAQLAALTGP